MEYGAVEFGFSAFEDGKLWALPSCHSIRSPERSVKEKISAELAITLIKAFFSLLARGKTFLRAEKQLVQKRFGMPTYKQKSRFYVEVRFAGSRLGLFLRGRLRHAATFSRDRSTV